MDEIFREIEHYGKYAENLRQMMTEAQSMIPARVEGRDKRRVALIVLAEDGLPGTVRIESDWTRKTKSEYLGEAVVNAFQSAVLAREAMLRIGRQIAERRVEGRSSDGFVTAVALLSGQIVGIEIDPRVYRKPDSKGLAASVMEAINRAISVAGAEHLDGLAEATGLNIGSYGEILSSARQLAEDLIEEAQQMRQHRR